MLYARHNCIFAWSCFDILYCFILLHEMCSKRLQSKFTDPLLAEFFHHLRCPYRAWALTYGIHGSDDMCGCYERLQLGHTVDWHNLSSVKFSKNSVSFWPPCLHCSYLAEILERLGSHKNKFSRNVSKQNEAFFANVFRRHYESLSLLKENKSINRKTEKIDFSRTSKFKESATNVRKLSAQPVNKCDAVGAGSDTRLICRYLMRWKQTPSQMLSALRNSICTVNVHIIFGPRPNNNLKNK